MNIYEYQFIDLCPFTKFYVIIKFQVSSYYWQVLVIIYYNCFNSAIYNFAFL